MTATEKSSKASKASPFSRGYSVTNGPKIHKKQTDPAVQSRGELESHHTPIDSLLSKHEQEMKEKEMRSCVSHIDLLDNLYF